MSEFRFPPIQVPFSSQSREVGLSRTKVCADPCVPEVRLHVALPAALTITPTSGDIPATRKNDYRCVVRKNSQFSQKGEKFQPLTVKATVVGVLGAARGLNSSRRPRVLQTVYSPYIISANLLGSKTMNEQAVVWVPGGKVSDGCATIVDICGGSSGRLNLGGDYVFVLLPLVDGTFLVLNSRETAAPPASGNNEKAPPFNCNTPPITTCFARWLSANPIPAGTFDEGFVKLSFDTFKATEKFNPVRMSEQIKTAAIQKWGFPGNITWSNSWPVLGEGGDFKYPGEPVFESFSFLDSVNDSGLPANAIPFGIMAGDIAEISGDNIVRSATTRITYSEGHGDGLGGFPSEPVNKLEKRVVCTCKLQKEFKCLPEIVMVRVFFNSSQGWNNNFSAETKKVSINFLREAMHELGHVLGIFELNVQRVVGCPLADSKTNAWSWLHNAMVQGLDPLRTWDQENLSLGNADKKLLDQLYPKNDPGENKPKVC
jgi:hypothetical protein